MRFVAGEYRSLTKRIAHNDPSPANVLAVDRRVTALLDFEFACPAPPALDLAMALRMTMRWWESADPWPAARAALAGYCERWPLSVEEARLLPELMRLRSSVAIYWWLGRAAPNADLVPVLRAIGYHRNAVRWLDTYGAQLVELARPVRPHRSGS
jgi:Ser/Thr protein kinase RdoA (MazF antagonist)